MKKRAEVNSEFKWCLDNYSLSKEELKKELDNLNKESLRIKEYEGKVMENSENLYTVLNQFYNLFQRVYDIYVVHSSIFDQDQSNNDNMSNLGLISSRYNDIMSNLSFINPEILLRSKEVVDQYIQANPNLRVFKRQLEVLFNEKKYILSVENEKIISKFSLIAGSCYDTYSILTNTEIIFDDVQDKDGNNLQLSEATWGVYSKSEDRVLRRNAFNELLSTYSKYKNTITSLYVGNIKTNSVYTSVRNYNSNIEKSLLGNEVDKVVYENLIEAVHSKIRYLHDYVSLRQEYLDFDEMHLYDMSTPLIPNIDRKYDFEEAKTLVFESLKPLGEDYTNTILKAFNENWIDVYPNKGKASGAYSSGGYKTVPYILLNYTDTIGDVFTLSHELGHSMQSHYTNQNNNFCDSQYKIFIAEIASTVNELLLFYYLMDNTDDIQTKKYLLNYNLEQFKSTVYRQTMFAEFEKKSNEAYETNNTLVEEELSNLYLDLNKKYFGKDVIVDELIKNEWLRIPHFYMDFYVYQYSTCFCIASYVAKKLFDKDLDMLTRYNQFLKAGDSKSPIDIVSSLGIDIRKTDIFNQALDLFGSAITEFREIK